LKEKEIEEWDFEFINYRILGLTIVMEDTLQVLVCHF